jgi:hypothetical protein
MTSRWPALLSRHFYPLSATAFRASACVLAAFSAVPWLRRRFWKRNESFAHPSSLTTLRLYTETDLQETEHDRNQINVYYPGNLRGALASHAWKVKLHPSFQVVTFPECWPGVRLETVEGKPLEKDADGDYILREPNLFVLDPQETPVANIDVTRIEDQTVRTFPMYRGDSFARLFSRANEYWRVYQGGVPESRPLVLYLRLPSADAGAFDALFDQVVTSAYPAPTVISIPGGVTPAKRDELLTRAECLRRRIRANDETQQYPQSFAGVPSEVLLTKVALSVRSLFETLEEE